MIRSLLRPTVALVVLSAASPVWAAEKSEIAAPSAAVAAAWAKEAEASAPSSTAVKALYASYGVLSTLDMVTTVQARNAGAREVNPMLAGSYGQAAATKALLAAATMASVRMIEKKSKKGAVLTMVALNVATAVVVANNYKNTRQLSQR